MSIFKKIKARYILALYSLSIILGIILIESVPLLKELVDKETIWGEYISTFIFILFMYIFIFRKDLATIKININSKDIDFKCISKYYLILSGLYISKLLLSISGGGNESKTTLTFFVYAVILAPIVEEVIMRGFLLNRFKMKFGLVVGVVLSSLAFYFAHFQLINLTTLLSGMLYAIVFLKTKNIINAIVLHSANNLTMFGIYLIQARNFFPDLSDNQMIAVLCISIISILASFTFGIIAIKKYLSSNTKTTIITN